MSERPFDGDDAVTEELNLDSDDAGSLEDAMRDALDAVERPGSARREAEDPFEAVDPDSSDGLREEIRELRDRSMRTLADFDNFRKRVERERREQRRYAGGEVLRELLAVVDNLERAIGAQGSVEEMKEGVELIRRQLEELLKSHGVERVAAEGGRFDPSSHEAVARHESDEVAEPTIVKELQAGYWLRDRLLRPALVEVAVPREPVSGAHAVRGAGADEPDN